MEPHDGILRSVLEFCFSVGRTQCQISTFVRKKISLACLDKKSFCSFASLVGGACGSSAEHPNDVQFVDLKNCNWEVKGHLKFCKIVANTESSDSELKVATCPCR